MQGQAHAQRRLVGGQRAGRSQLEHEAQAFVRGLGFGDAALDRDRPKPFGEHLAPWPNRCGAWRRRSRRRREHADRERERTEMAPDGDHQQQRYRQR